MKRTLLYIPLFLVILMSTDPYAFMTGISPDKDGGSNLQILEGIILQGPPNAEVNAGYGILKNITDKDIQLIRLTSPVFDKVQLHDTQYSNDGIAKMIKIKEPVIPANGVLVLERGGKHLMLINRRRDLKIGEIILMMVESKSENRYMLQLKVIDPREKKDHGHDRMYSH